MNVSMKTSVPDFSSFPAFVMTNFYVSSHYQNGYYLHDDELFYIMPEARVTKLVVTNVLPVKYLN